MSLINRAYGNSVTLGKNLFTTVQGTWLQNNDANATDFDDQFVTQAGHFWNTAGRANNDEIKIPDFVVNSGTYEIKVVVLTSAASPILEVLHGAVSIGTNDCYSAGTVYNVIKTFIYSPTTRVSADLRFKVSGKNGASSDYYLYISRIQIRKIGEAVTQVGVMTPATGMGTNLGTNSLNWNYIYSKHLYRDGADLVMGDAGGGTTKVGINTNNVLFPVQAPTASAPAAVLGGQYFDTTLNKLRITGAGPAWETVTSV